MRVLYTARREAICYNSLLDTGRSAGYCAGSDREWPGATTEADMLLYTYECNREWFHWPVARCTIAYQQYMEYTRGIPAWLG